MDHQVRVADFVEEALEHDAALGGQHAQRRFDAARYSVSCCAAGPGSSSSSCSQARSLRRRLRAICRPAPSGATPHGTARRCGQALASQNGIVGGWPFASSTSTLRLDLGDAVRGIAELEHIARQALEREVLVERADTVPSGSSTTS